MSTEYITLGIVAFVSLLLAVWLGRLYRPQAGGLSEADTREVLAIVIVVAVLVMVGLGRTVPEFIIMAFGAVITEIIRKGKDAPARVAKPEAAPEPYDPTKGPPAPRDTSGMAGFVCGRQLVLMLGVAVVGLGTMAVLSSCQSVMAPAISAAQNFNDKLAERYGKTNELAEAREALAKSEAEKAGLTLLSRDAIVFADEIREQRTDRLITNGVYRRRVYEERETIAAAPLPVTPPPTAGSQQPIAAPVASNNVVTTPAPTNHAGHDSNQAGSVVTPSHTIESRVYQVAASVTSASGPLPLSGAAIELEITVSGPLGWSDGIGAVELAGRVLSVSNSPFPLDVAALTFDGYAGTVSNGTLWIASQGGDVQFSGSADLSSGAIVGNAKPEPGSAATAFFSSATLSGTGILVERVVEVVTSQTAVATNAPAPQTADQIPVEGFVALGKHAKVNPARIAITDRLVSARIEGGNVRLAFDPLGWSTTSDKGKTVDGRVYIAWQDGDHWTGGHFDWHGLHQTVKTLGNIPGGYLDHKQPPHGAPVAFCLIDLDGKQRTQFVLSENRWP